MADLSHAKTAREFFEAVDINLTPENIGIFSKASAQRIIGNTREGTASEDYDFFMYYKSLVELIGREIQKGKSVQSETVENLVAELNLDDESLVDDLLAEVADVYNINLANQKVVNPNESLDQNAGP